jgi:anthranilate/para-aminobenzoate synthase component I
MNLTPSVGEARRLARSYDVVPLYAEFIGDLETPISAVLRFAEEDTVFLLESAEAAERFGRYSFLGFDPKRTLSYRDWRLYRRGLGRGARDTGGRPVPGASRDPGPEERRHPCRTSPPLSAAPSASSPTTPSAT